MARRRETHSCTPWRYKNIYINILRRYWQRTGCDIMSLDSLNVILENTNTLIGLPPLFWPVSAPPPPPKEVLLARLPSRAFFCLQGRCIRCLASLFPQHPDSFCRMASSDRAVDSHCLRERGAAFYPAGAPCGAGVDHQIEVDVQGMPCMFGPIFVTSPLFDLRGPELDS